MDKKAIISSFISFAVAILILASVVFAWFTLQSQSNIEDFIINVNDLKSEILLEVKRNDEDFVVLETIYDYNEMFQDALPSYKFLFKLTITNKSTRTSSIKVVLHDIVSYNIEGQEDWDMREVFYVEEGIVSINGINQKQLRPENADPDVVFDPYPFNIKDLLINKNIVLLNTYSLEVDEETVIEFTLIYNENTSDIEYQDGSLGISGIYIYNN